MTSTLNDQYFGHKDDPVDDAAFPAYDWRNPPDRRSIWTKIFRPRRPSELDQRESVGRVNLWYPHASRQISMPVRGEYADGYPIGAVVHNTEGYSKKGDENAEDTMKDGIGNGYCYFCISSTGKVYQPAPLKNWGYHCGPTYHPTMGRSLAQKLVGIEVCNAGLLVNTDRGWQPRDFHKDYPDRVWHETFADDERRDSPKVFNVTVAGVYHGMTATQETALTELLLWMHQNNPHVFKLENVVGHDEVAVEGNGTELGRKQDPGASLSLYMPAFRTKLQQLSATS